MFRKLSSLLISLCLIFQQIGFASMATELNIAGHLSKMPSSLVADRFRPVHIRFFSFDAQNDNIKVMLDKGDVKSLKANQINESTKELLNYFLVGITLPNDKFWVNLRPDSEDNIIDNWLAKTDVGKIMLEADLQLKKDTAQFTSPQTSEGKEYWNRLYKKAEELYGYQEVSIPTLTRPWIVPNEVIVRESKESAYIYKATLKVMLEQDFLKDSSVYNFKDARAKALNEYSSQLIRELIIPKLTQEVNLSKRYAPLRQVYYSIVLSRWFKSRFANQTGKYASRIDRRDLTGLASATAWSKSTYFDAYKKSFAQGEYNIKETVRTPTGQVIRSYFSGGLDLAKVNLSGGRASGAIEQSLLTAGLIRPGMAGDIKITSSPLMVNKNVEFLHSVPEALKALANRNLKGVNVLIRVNVNVPSKNGGIADPARIIKIKQIGDFILARGGTPVFFGHNGSLDKKSGKDKRESLANVAKYMRANFFPNLIFNENSITEQGVQIGWSDILQGAPNLLQHVRAADDYEVGPKRMILAKSLARLAGDKNGKNKILIVDAFGDVGSDGASVGTIPFLMDEVYTGPEMVTEFNDLEEEVKKGFDVVLFGGIKAPKLASLDGLEAALNPDGFMFIASGLTPALKKMPDFLKKLQGENPDRILTTIDYSDETGNDIGAKTLEMVLSRLDVLKPGQRVFVNGTMGNMEDKSGKYTAGTDRVWEKLKELARRGVLVIVVGGDAGSTTVKYGLDKEPNVKTYSGGGVAFTYIANEDLPGLRALARRYLQLQNEAETGKRFNAGFNGGRGRMSPLYLQGILENEKYARIRPVALNGIPLADLDKFVTKLTTPDSTYGTLFPGLEVKVIERNSQNKYAIIELDGFINQDRDEEGKPIPQRILVLDDRKDAVRWNLVGELFGEEYLTRAGILETSGQDLEWAKTFKRHLTAVPEGLVMYGAPPKADGVPIAVFGVNEEEVEKDSQILSNASCTTNCIAPVANALHRGFGVIKGFLLTIHSETSDQSSSETFRGDEPGRGRPGHKVQSPAKTGAATLLPKLIKGIGPNDGKAIRAGTLTGSVVVYSAELEKPATVKEIQDLFIQAAKDNPKVFGIGRNLSTKDIVKDPHSTIIDLDSIQVSPDGKKVKIAAWYDNEWGYAQRGLDMFLLALEKQANGERTKDFDVPAAAAKKETKPKTVPASDLEGLDSEGALPMFIPVQRSFTGKPTDLYLTGIKEKQGRNGQIVLRMLLGDPRFNLKAIVVEGITSANFEATMKAFAQSVLYSADLGNISGVKLTPRLTDKDEMYLVLEVGNVKRLVRVLPSLGGDIASEAKVIDITKIKYSYADMIKTIEDSLKPTGAELLSATISMSTRPGGELLDSGKGISVAGNSIPMRINELDKTGIMYSAYQVPVDSGSYLVTTFTINGSVDKETINDLVGSIPGIEIDETTSSDFVGHRTNMVYDKSQTVIIADKKAEGTMVSLFFLVNEELNAANKALEETAASSAILAAEPHLSFTDVSAVRNALKGVVEVTPDGVNVINEAALRGQLIDNLVYDATFNPNQEVVSETRKLIKNIAASLGIAPTSSYDKFIQKAKDPAHYTTPAINVRGMGFDTARAIFKSAVKNNVVDRPFMLEIAKSEIGYTGQRPAEFATTMFAAAIKEGYNHPVYLKGDHFQVALKDYQKDPVQAIENAKKLIREAIETGSFYQIDLDMSPLVDYTKSTVAEQQELNYEFTAKLTRYVRDLERELGLDKQGITVNLAGEIGEIGMGMDKAKQQNSTADELRAFANGYNARLKALSLEAGYEIKPITIVAVQTGTKHGGVRDAKGKITKAKVGFNTLGELGRIARQEFGLAGVVQHGASTLPEEYFILFSGNPAPEGTEIAEELLNALGKENLNDHPVAEVHLATAYQDEALDHSEFPQDIRQDMRNYVLSLEAVQKEIAKGVDEEKAYTDARKNVWGPYKLHVWNMPETIKIAIRDSLEVRFDTVFKNLGVAAASSAIHQQEVTAESLLKAATARQVFDSRGFPTVETEVTLPDGRTIRVIVPSGASTGEAEALELRDGGKDYKGKGVTKAVDNANKIIIPALLEGLRQVNIFEQRKIDAFFNELDGDPQNLKRNLGANAVLAMSLLVAKIGAYLKDYADVEFYKYINKLFGTKAPRIPLAMMNVLNGGKHAPDGPDIQEFMIGAVSAKSFKEQMRITTEVFHTYGDLLKNNPTQLKKAYGEAMYQQYNLSKVLGREIVGSLGTAYGDEGGYVPAFKNNREPFLAITAAIRLAGYNQNGQIDVALGMDGALSEWDKGSTSDGKYRVYNFKKPLVLADGTVLGRKLESGKWEITSLDLIRFYKDLIIDTEHVAYLFSIEDGLGEKDWKGAEEQAQGWETLTSEVGPEFAKQLPFYAQLNVLLQENYGITLNGIQIVTDDPTATNPRLTDKAIGFETGNSLLDKLNQIGTLTEAADAGNLALKARWNLFTSHRSGESEDTTIAHFSVGLGGGFLKTGAPNRTDRNAKYNELLRIEENLAASSALSKNDQQALTKPLSVLDGSASLVVSNNMDSGVDHSLQALDRNMESSPDQSLMRNLGVDSASSAIDGKKGGIDFRAPAMTIKYQPMGNFAGLNPKLPVLSKAELAVFNIDQELSGMEKLVNSQMIPSGDRLKEVLAACSQKGELGANKERLVALLVKIGIVEETQCCLQDASQGYKEALVLADSLA